MKANILFYLVLTLAAICVYVVIHFSGWPVPTFANEITLLLTVTTAVLYSYLAGWYNKNPQLFTQFYLLSIALKLLGYGALAGVVIYLDPGQAVPNVILFLVAYLLFTLLEIIFLFPKVASGSGRK